MAYTVKQSIRELSVVAWNKTISKMRPIQYHYLQRIKEKPFTLSIADNMGIKLNRIQMLTATLLFMKSLKKRLKEQENVAVVLPDIQLLGQW